MSGGRRYWAYNKKDHAALVKGNDRTSVFLVVQRFYCFYLKVDGGMVVT
jgi:hypothetical protein